MMFLKIQKRKSAFQMRSGRRFLYKLIFNLLSKKQQLARANTFATAATTRMHIVYIRCHIG